MNKLLLFFVGASLLFFSCKEKKEIYDCSNTTVWENVNIDNQQHALSELIQIERIIGLEEKTESLIGKIDKIVCHDSLLFVMDNETAKKIFLYNSNTGKYIRTLGQAGGGPAEYVVLNDISYDPENEILYALCDYNKVIGYTIDGDIAALMIAPFRMYKMESISDGFCFVCEDETTGEIVFTDSELNVTKTHFANNKTTIKHRLIHPIHKNTDGTIDYFRYIDNNIYNLSSNVDNPAIVKYSVDFGDNGYNREEFEGKDKETIKQTIASKRGQIKYYVANDDYAIILFFDQKQPCLSFFDIKKNISHSMYATKLSEEFLGMIYSPIEYTDGNYFIQIVDNPEFADLRCNKDIHSGENPLIFFMK